MDTVAPQVRRIAILVTSLDAAAARQLLVHMPPELAKQVRKAVANLNHIDPVEQARVLAEFRKQALSNAFTQPEKPPPLAITPTSTESVTYARELNSSAGTRANTVAKSNSRTSPLTADGATTESANSARVDAALDSTADQLSWQQGIETKSAHARSWKGLDCDALVHLLRGERAAVIAVVLSQLDPESAVALLKSLPRQEHSQILARLARLQDIDEEAMAAIDDHLARSLRDYRHEMTSASESLARLEALLSFAPPQLREQWLQDITRQDSQLAHRLGLPPPPAESPEYPLASSMPATSSHPTASTSQSKGASATRPVPAVDALANHVVTTVDLASQPDNNGDRAQIIPFTQKSSVTQNDNSLASIEFEQILELPPEQLAMVLSESDAEVILLALAGASPEFMKQLYELLDRQDAKALQKRLRNIGPLNLRDIDEAQLEVAELAAHISSSSSTRNSSRQHVNKVAA